MGRKESNQTNKQNENRKRKVFKNFELLPYQKISVKENVLFKVCIDAWTVQLLLIVSTAVV